MKNLLLKFKDSVRFLLLVSSALFFFGCSPSKPSEGDGKQAVKNQINQDAQGRIKLVEFHKTNGQSAEVNAVKVYRLEFSAEIEFSEDCKWLTAVTGQGYSFRTSKLVAPDAQKKTYGFSWNQFADAGQNPGTPVQKGQRMQVLGVIRFEKTENGWSVDGIDINQATPVARTSNTKSEANQQTSQPATAADTSHTSSVNNSQPANNQPSDSEVLYVVKTLEAINQAKEMWALEKSKINGAVPTESDITPYMILDAKGKIPAHPSGGHWILNAYGTPPESSKYGKLDDLDAKYHDQLHPRLHPVWESMTPEKIQQVVANDLRQIDAAKNQWSLANMKNTGVPTETDLGRFLPFNGYLPEHPPGGNWIINPVGTPPASSTYGKLGDF